MKHIFAIAFSAVVLVSLPAFDMSRAEAWTLILMLLTCGMEIAYLAEDACNKMRRRRRRRCRRESERRRERRNVS